MLQRIVKMTFRPECVEDFERVFEERRELIGGFEGCAGVVLLRDIDNPNIYFTYSRWKDVASLENYRNSELFNGTWALVKPLFGGKPEAWSVREI